LRGDLNFDTYRVAASLGETTQNFTPRILEGQPEFGVDHIALTRRLGDYGWARLSTSGWRPQNNQTLLSSFRPPEVSRVVSFDADPDISYWNNDLDLSRGYGLELTEPTGSLPGDRRAYDWDLTWRQPRFRLDARQFSQGRAYGPGHFENFRRGQSNLHIGGTVDLAPNLQWRESYDRFTYAFPIESGQRRGSENDTVSHELYYQPTSSLSATALLSYSQNKIQPSGSEFDTRRLQLRANWRASDRLRLNLSHFDIETSSLVGETQSRRSDLRADYWLDERNRVTALVGRSRVAGLNVVNEGLDLGLGYEHLLEDDLGRFRLDYRQSRFGFSTSTFKSYQASFSLNPDPRWRIRGNYSIFDTGPRSQTSASINMDYLLNEHQEIGFNVNQRPFLLFPDQPGLNLGMTTFGIELRQSFGGSLQTSFARRLEPRLRVSFEAEHPDLPGVAVPVEGAKVRVDGEVLATTNEEGLAEMSVSQGRHEVELDLSEVGRHFVMAENPSGDYRFGAADRRTLNFKAIGYSGIRIITWNDFFGEGDLPVGYVPVSSVPLLVDGRPVTTNAQGELVLERLIPGSHEVQVLADGLPPGLEILGATSFQVDVEPGQEKLITIPLRGFATVEGQVKLLGGLIVPKTGLGIEANDQEIGRTDAEGRFKLKAPAGTVVIEVDTRELGSRAFVPGEPEPLKLSPGDFVKNDLLVSRTAELVVQLTLAGQPLALQGVPLTLEGEGFRYTDAGGTVRFPGLRPGQYTLSWDEATLPKGYQAAGPAKATLNLEPGEDRVVRIELREDK
jgi:hypothetical protein